MEKLLLTVGEAADVLRVSRSRVYELIYAEQLDSVSAYDLTCRLVYDLTCRSRRIDHCRLSPPETRVRRSLSR